MKKRVFVLSAFISAFIYSFQNLRLLADDQTIITFCEDIGVLKTFRILGYILLIIKIMAPSIIIIKGIESLTKCILNNIDDLKQTVFTLIKRIILGAFIFFIPNILTAIFGLVDNYNKMNLNGAKCGICLTGANSSSCASIIKKAQTKWEKELASAAEETLKGRTTKNTTSVSINTKTTTKKADVSKTVAYGYNCTGYLDSSSYNASKAAAIIARGETKLGTPYSKMDCSDFVSYVFKDYLADSTAAGLAKATRGNCVELDDVRPGDIFFTSHYDTSGTCQNCIGSTHGNRCNRFNCIMHTGIVAEVKNGKITKVIHSNNGVEYQNMNFRYSPTSGKSWLIMVTRPY